MKSRRGKVRRSLALFLALALIFTTFLGDVSIANAQEAVETEANADEKPEKQEKEAPAEKPQKKPASEEKKQEKPAAEEKKQEKPASEEKSQEKEAPAEKLQEKSDAAEKPQEKSDAAEKPQEEPEKKPAAEETKQPEAKDAGSESAAPKTDDKAETPKNDASSKDEAKSDKENDASKKTGTYTVRFKVNNSDAGVITVDGSSVNAASYKKDVDEGEDFRFGVTAKEGFDVESVKVENANVAKDSGAKDGYIVKEVKKNTEIAVQYKEVPKEKTEENPETDKEVSKEDENTLEETEETPEAVKAFLDAVAALPSADQVTKENAEKIGEQVNAVLDMWDAMDEELAEREDVQAALEKVYAVYEAVLKAEEIEDAKGYSERQLPYKHSSGVTKSAFQDAVNLDQGYTCNGTVKLNGEEEYDQGTPNVWPTGNWGGSVNVTDYNWVHIINSDPNVATVSWTKSGGQLTITFKPGSKSGTTRISVGVDAKYPHYSLGTWNMELNFDYTVTNTGSGEVVPGNKPAKPTVNDVPTNKQNGYVYVKCVTYPNANPLYNSTRTHAGYMSLQNSAVGWSFGEVYANDGRFGSDAPAEEYPWLCDLTLNSNWYLERWNSSYSKNEGTHYLNDPGKTVSMTFVSDGNEWYYFTEDVPLVVWITHTETTYYAVKYTDGVKDEEVFKDQITSGLKEGDKTPEFKAADKGTVTKNDGTVEPVREGYTFMGWSPAVNPVVSADDADGNGNITYTATWQKDPESVKKITGIVKKLIKSAAEAPSGLDVTEITWPNADGKVIIPDDGTSITLLYKITVTGDPGKEYKVIDTGATRVGGDAMKGTIPESGSAVIYVTRAFTKDDIGKDGKVKNTAAVTPGKDDDTSSTSTETTPTDTPKNTTLQVTKTADKDSAEKGETIVYTITVKNTGAFEAKNVIITDKLDNNKLDFISAQLGNTSFATEPTGGKYPAGNIPAGQSVTLTITAKVKDNVKPEDVIHNTADADLDNPEGDVTPGNKDVTVGGSSLDVTKSRITDAEVVAGETVKWRITITNNTGKDKTVAISDILSNQENISVTDEKGTESVASITIASGATKILYASYVTKASDINTILKNAVTVTPDDGDEKTAEDEGTKVVSPDRKITVQYVSDKGETIKDSVIITKNSDGASFKDGDSYDVNSEILPAIDKDGHHYIKEKVEGDVEGTINGADVVIKVIYTVDDIGTDPENPTPVDPTPENPTPENPTPENPTPENPTPENPMPEDPMPENPTPVDPAPTTTVTPTITPTTPATPIIARITPTPVTPTVTPAGLTPATPAIPVLTPGGEEAEPEEQPEVRAVEDEDAPLANTEIKDEEVPLAGSSDRWALINFALMNLAIFESLMLLIGYFVQTKKSSEEEEEEDEKEKKLKKKGIIRLISLPVAIVSLIAFFLTENIWLPTKLVDEYTLMMAVIAIFQTVVVALSRKEENAEEEEPEAEMA